MVVQAVPVVEAGETVHEMPGLWGEYFQLASKLDVNSKFPEIPADARPTSTRSEATLDFPRTYGRSLGRGERDGDFYARWTGSLRLDRAMRFQLTLFVEDAGRVFVDGKLVIDLSAVIGKREQSAWLKLADGDHPVLIEFAHTAGWNACQLFWSADGQSREIVPSRMLVHTPKVASTMTTTLTDARGRFRFVELPPGGYTLRAQVPGGFATPDNPKTVTITKDGAVTGVDFHLSPFKKGRWQHWTHTEGLLDDFAPGLMQDSAGAMWFATGSGVTRFDGQNFHSWTTRDGLPDSRVNCACEGEPGVMWFGTRTGLVRHDARDTARPFTIFTTTNGLPDNLVTALQRDRAGQLWVGTTNGLARLDGTNFVTYSGWIVPDIGPGHHDGRLMGDAKLVESRRPAGPEPSPMQVDTILQTYRDTDFLFVPPNVLEGIETATIEAWTRWNGSLLEDKQESFLRIFRGVAGKNYLNFNEGMGTNWKSLHSWIKRGDTNIFSLEDDAINFTRWNHVALVTGPAGMKLYRNGELVSSSAEAFSFARLGPMTNLGFGRLFDRNTSPEDALAKDRAATMDEIRIWNRERTANEIRANMYRNLTGNEPDLVALWNFDQPVKPGLRGVQVSSLLSDTHGTLWAGTDAGVSRFDGANWVNYSVTDGLAKGNVPQWPFVKSALFRWGSARQTARATLRSVSRLQAVGVSGRLKAGLPTRASPPTPPGTACRTIVWSASRKIPGATSGLPAAPNNPPT